MSLINEFQDVQGQPLMARSRNTAYFDFVIAERPTYIPNTGPPLEPMSIMPAHDKDGVIEGEFNQPDNLFTYLVTFPDHPALRVSVKPQNIREWVSARTLENWNLDEINRRQEEQREYLKEIANARAKKGDPSRVANEKKKKGKQGQPQGWKRKVDEIESPEMPSSARRRSSAAAASGLLAGPTRMRKQPLEEPAVFTSPTKPQLSRGPSLVTPVKGLATIVASIEDMNPTDTDDMDEENDDEAILAQLSSMAARNSPSRSSTKIPDPFSDNQQSNKPSQSSSPRRRGGTSPDAVAHEDAAIHQMSSQEQQGISAPSPFFSGRNPTAATSSRDALRTYESLEREKGRQVAPKSVPQLAMPAIGQKYSKFWGTTSPGVSNMSAAASSESSSASSSSSSSSSSQANAIPRNTAAAADSFDRDALASQPKVPSKSIREKYSNFWNENKYKDHTISKIDKESSVTLALESMHQVQPDPDGQLLRDDLGEQSQTEQENQMMDERHIDGHTAENEDNSDGVEEDELEWEVEAILRDGQRIDEHGILKPHYLIKWVGDWDNTWEPEDNIGQHLKNSYHARQGRLAAKEVNKNKASKGGPRKSLSPRNIYGDDNMDDDNEPASGGISRKSRTNEREKLFDPESQSLFISDDDETPRNQKHAKGKQASRRGQPQALLDLTSDTEDDSDPFAD